MVEGWFRREHSEQARANAEARATLGGAARLDVRRGGAGAAVRGGERRRRRRPAVGAVRRRAAA